LDAKPGAVEVDSVGLTCNFENHIVHLEQVSYKNKTS
jgi:hypothetical protein